MLAEARRVASENFVGQCSRLRLTSRPDFKTMKVTRNWLKHYVDLNWSVAELTERVTLPGLALRAALR